MSEELRDIGDKYYLRLKRVSNALERGREKYDLDSDDFGNLMDRTKTYLANGYDTLSKSLQGFPVEDWKNIRNGIIGSEKVLRMNGLILSIRAEYSHLMWENFGRRDNGSSEGFFRNLVGAIFPKRSA